MSFFFLQLPRFILQAMYSNSYDLTRAIDNCPLSTPPTWLLADYDLAGYHDGGTPPIAHGIVSLRGGHGTRSNSNSCSSCCWVPQKRTKRGPHPQNYTAEFLPIISPLRECTTRPSYSTEEFTFSGDAAGCCGVLRGCFSSSL